MEDTPPTPDPLSPAMLPHLSLLLLTPDPSMEDSPPTPDQLSPAMLLGQLSPPLDTLPTLDQSMEDTPATMARERLKLNQRLMLMLFMATTDMVLDTLPTPDLSMEDTPPTPDQLSPAMLLDQWFPPLDTLPTPDQSMEDTPATMAREMLKLNQRLMPNTLDTLDYMEDTPPMPDPLFPLSTPDLLSPLSTPDQLSPLSTPEESMDTTKPTINQKDNQRH